MHHYFLLIIWVSQTKLTRVFIQNKNEEKSYRFHIKEFKMMYKEVILWTFIISLSYFKGKVLKLF